MLPRESPVAWSHDMHVTPARLLWAYFYKTMALSTFQPMIVLASNGTALRAQCSILLGDVLFSRCVLRTHSLHVLFERHNLVRRGMMGPQSRVHFWSLV